MRAAAFQSSLLPLRSAVLAALGLSSLTACGGATSQPGPGEGGSGGAGTGGALATGGASATGGAGGSGGLSTGGSSSGGRFAFSCDNGSAAERPAPGDAGGFEPCRGAVHRPFKAQCPTSLPRSAPTAACAGVTPNPELGTCRLDSDCARYPNGFCEMAGAPAPSCQCLSGCRQDSDCSDGMLCLCGDPVGTCVPATCTLDSECGPGLACLSYTIQKACPYTSFACQTPSDRCASSADCAAGQTCSPGANGRECTMNSCPPVGRPFLVGGAARVAPVVSRADWCSDLSPSVDGICGAALASIAESWTDAALMEHASIAAFARFALELLSLGAPAHLIEATHAAIGDETVHARDAFALASAYGGRPVGPGTLPEAAFALGGRTPADIVETAILEGCIGETVAAAEAAEALAGASDPAVREALTRVVADETRHAELAWRFVQWVVVEDVAGLRDVALRALDAASRTELVAASASAADRRDLPHPALAAHGLLGPALRAHIRRSVLADVVAPAASALRASVLPQDKVILRNGMVTTKTAPAGWLSST